MTPEEWRARLIEEQRELETLSRDSSEGRGAVTLDQQSVGRVSRIDAMQQQAMAQEAERRRLLRRRRIESALKRLDEGDFGYCVHCGEAIAEERLKFDPTVPSCVACAK
ncbi:MAG: TraR/DksA family transcriptional regulator [Rhodomicrobiaceae bacterium]